MRTRSKDFWFYAKACNVLISLVNGRLKVQKRISPKVFWFFFSKKNYFLVAAPARPQGTNVASCLFRGVWSVWTWWAEAHPTSVAPPSGPQGTRQRWPWPARHGVHHLNAGDPMRDLSPYPAVIGPMR
jgi:hypothetical protein